MNGDADWPRLTLNVWGVFMMGCETLGTECMYIVDKKTDFVSWP